jgi:hypothetical protein
LCWADAVAGISRAPRSAWRTFVGAVKAGERTVSRFCRREVEGFLLLPKGVGNEAAASCCWNCSAARPRRAASGDRAG